MQAHNLDQCDYNQAIKCEGRLSRIETNVDHILSEVRELKDVVGHNIDDRLKRLERWQAWILGAGAVVGVALTLAWNLVIK